MSLLNSSVTPCPAVSGRTSSYNHRVPILLRGEGRPGRLHALVLRPIGDGSSEHLEAAVLLPAEITLAEGLQEVGRELPADAVCSVPTVSTRHAMLRVENGVDVYITDLNSTNGTFVRYPGAEDPHELEPMEWTPLPTGSEIVFGDIHLAKFELVNTGDTS